MEEEAAEARAVSVVEESPSRRVPKDAEVEQGIETDQQQQTSLVDIHRRVLSRILPRQSDNASSTSIESLQHRLDILKRKRLYLESELARKRVSFTTVSEELMHNHKEQQATTTSSARQNTHKNNNNNNNDFVVAERRMHLRKKRRIAGSHRLAGISVVPTTNDDNVLGIRLDICVQGRYVNRSYLFFQQQEPQKENGQLLKLDETEQQLQQQHEQTPRQQQLKLVQHTLPQGVMLASLDVGRTIDLSIDNLQQYIGTIYDACYSHAIRQDVVDFIKSQQQEVDNLLSVTDVDCNNALNCISFRLKSGNDDGMLRVVLRYSDPFSSLLPTEVKVSRVMTTSSVESTSSSQPTNPLGNNAENVLVEVSSDDEEDSSIMNAVGDAFRTCGIREAIQKVTEHLTA